jgi:hypothetical protein
MADVAWNPVGLDVTTPNVARMYDYFLGGKDNFAADREAAEKILELAPEVPFVVRENRAFLARAVRFLAEAGIRQFIDIGTGLPTQSSVHEVARQVAPDARVVYVDNDPVVLAHGQALLTGVGNALVVRGDLRDPGTILNAPGIRDFIDFDQPVAVLLLAILHFIPDADDPAGVIDRLRESMAPGSYLAITHVAQQDESEDVPKVMAVYNASTAPVAMREHGEILPFFAGFELVDPGLVHASAWRPDSGSPGQDPGLSRAFAGVACRT